MNINKIFKQLFQEDISSNLPEKQLSLPVYCGGSIIKDIDEDKIYSIDLYLFSLWSNNKVLSKNITDYIRKFMQEKIDNGTLYTSELLNNYSLIKRFQLFINSNIAEHAIADILDGKLLKGNDELTINSTAIIGEDNCALADVNINGIETEVKVIYSKASKPLIFSRAHKKSVVAIYTIKPSTNNHWEFYTRNSNGEYTIVNFNDNNIISNWQDKMNKKVSTLPLLYFQENSNGSLTITKMIQK